MKPSKALITLSILTLLLALVQSGVGLFWQDGGQPFLFTTLQGQNIQMYGQGIYHNDPYFSGPILRGTDAITLFVAIPLLAVAIAFYLRGSLRGTIFLSSMLAYFLYDSASLAFGVAYNQLFPLYLAFFSSSLFAFILAFRSIDSEKLVSHATPGLPNRGIAILLLVAAAGLFFAWSPDMISALIKGEVAAIASYTTAVTYILDLGIIVPALILASIYLLQRKPLGYLLGLNLIILLALMGLVVTAQTVAQSLAGITLSAGEFIGKAGSFMVLAIIAIFLIVRFFHHVTEPNVH